MNAVAKHEDVAPVNLPSVTVIGMIQSAVERGADVRSAVIYTKPTTIIQPDFSWKNTDLWIDFPWSWQGSVVEEDQGLPGSA